MFGNPDWFRKSEGRTRIRPASWKGWIYRSGWLAAIALPTLLLFANSKGPEALIWLATAGGLFAWEWHKIKRGVGHAEKSDVLYIGDEDAPPDRVATANYEMYTRG